MATYTGSNLGAVATIPGPNAHDDVTALSVGEVAQAAANNDVTLEVKKLDKTGGTITSNLVINGTLQVDGNTTLGNASTDTITTPGKIKIADFSSVSLTQLSATGETRTRVAKVTYLYDTADWAIGSFSVVKDGVVETSSPPASAPGHKVTIRIDGPPHQAKLTGWTVYLHPSAHGGGNFPAVRPTVTLVRRDIPTGTESSDSPVSDPSANQTAYELRHTISATGLSYTWDATTDQLYLLFESEYGTGTASGLLIEAVTITYEQMALDC